MHGTNRVERKAVLAAPERVAAVDRAREMASRSLADRLARLAAEAVDAAIGLVSLVDADKQIVLGSFGPVAESGAEQMSLHQALCDEVVTAGIPIIISDSTRRRLGTTDQRPGPPSYVGFPVRDAEDQVVGVLAVADLHPREWSARELAVIDDAAQLFTAGLAGEIDRRRERALDERSNHAASFADALLDSLQTGVAACDADGRLLMFNRSMREMLGADADGCLPDQWVAHFHARHVDGQPYRTAELPLLRALRGEHVHDVDMLIMPPERQPRLLSINGRPIVSRGRDRVGAVITAEDVTMRRRAERLQACELAVAQAITEGPSLEQAGRTVLAEIGQSLGWPHGELWIADDLTDTMLPVARWDMPGREPPVRMPEEIVKGSGLPGTVWATGTPMWIPDIATGPLADRDAAASRLHAALAVPVRGAEQTIGVLMLYGENVEEPQTPLIAVLLGMAAQVGQFLERRRAEDLAARLARSEEEYIALVGHELRTPLTSITAYAELLRDSPDAATLGSVRDLLAVVERNTGLLFDTVENLLDLAAVDSGDAPLDFEPANLTQLVRDGVTAHAEGAADHGVTIRARVPERLVLLADPDRLSQVIDHLLSNAIRYSPDGGTVEVSLERVGSAAVLTVTDVGMGIPLDERDKVVRRFFRSTRSREHGIRGTGLGLSLCAAVVERHRGTLVLTPREPRGTTAVVRLPLRGAGGPRQTMD